MLKDRLIAFLKILPEETRMVSLMAVLFLCLQAGQGFGENAAFALFLSSVKVDYLPYMYMGLGGVVFLASIFFSASLSRFQNSSVVVNFLAGAILLFSLEWIFIVFAGNAVSYPVLWLTTYGSGVVFGTLLWTVAGEVCDARQAKRLFPLFTSMGILGSVLGNSLTGLVAKAAGTTSLIIFYVLLLGIGFVVVRRVTKEYFKTEPDANIRFSLIDDIRAGYQFVRGSQLFRLIALSSILYSILFFTVDFPFSERISIQFANDSAGLAGFKGLFTSLVTAVTFLVSLFLANRLYTKLGIVNSVLIMPITYVVTFIVFFVSFNFWGAVGARFGQLVILGGLGGTAWNALFNVVPSERRGQVLSFNNGVPAQIGVVLSGLLIILSRRALETQDILLLGLTIAIVTVQVTRKMRPAYGEALLSALRAGRVEVFSEEADDFAGYQNDPMALEVTRDALNDPRPLTRRLAVEMLARMGGKTAAHDIVEHLNDEDASVRAAAVGALVDLDAKDSFKHVIMGLDDESDEVREQTLAALPKLEVASTPELIRTLERLLENPNLKIASHAAIVLLYLGETSRALAFVAKTFKDKDPIHRITPFSSYRVIASMVNTVIPFDKGLVRAALHDPAPVVRREAARIVSFLMDESIVDDVITLLGDPDTMVKRNASESLKQNWDISRGVLIRMLQEADESIIAPVMDSIPTGDAGILDALLTRIHREVAWIQYLRALVEPLPLKGRMTKLLVYILRYRILLREERLVKAVGLFGDQRAMNLVRAALVEGDASARAAALEALETLGDKRVTAEVLPILESDSSDMLAPFTLTDAMKELLKDQDPELRSLAMFVIAELALEEFVPKLRELSVSDDKLTVSMARDALSRMGGTSIMKTSKNIKTLRTLTTLDRILFFREVPMFSRLTPDDLERIAEIAEEQLFLEGSFLCREGERGDTLFIITDGMVDVVKTSGNVETVLATQSVGSYVGEMAVLESAPRSATLRARSNVRALVINGDAFNTILLDRPEVAVSVLQHMSHRVRELNQRVGVSA
ncbi:MAG: HEAT repeat domain-containing protein [Anaerolineales bacterium]|nr:HEAT repeat domain-containing protein [Anaerolineales bacterium]